MAARMAARFVPRRLLSSGKILSEEEKAAENIYIKKIEKEKLEKLARKGPTAGEAAAPEQAASEVKPTGAPQSSSSSSTSGGVSADKNRNYAVLAGTVAAASAFGWWYFSKPEKTEDVGE